MEPTGHERRLFVCFSLDRGYARKTDETTWDTFTETHVRHVIRDLFPEAVFADLTEDTARLDVVVRKSNLTRSHIYGTSFYRGDGSLIKKKDYDEDTMHGMKTTRHDKRADQFIGKIYGADVRLVVFR
jgi:hypothetical protein